MSEFYRLFFVLSTTLQPHHPDVRSLLSSPIVYTEKTTEICRCHQVEEVTVDPALEIRIHGRIRLLIFQLEL